MLLNVKLFVFHLSTKFIYFYILKPFVKLIIVFLLILIWKKILI